jgi:pimeloyl-ACP methyl ester carboxylesterase
MAKDTRPEPPPIAGVRRRRVSARGVLFHVTEAGPEDGLPVLCLHGWPQHHYEWRDLLSAPPEGMRIVAPDLPGYGWSGPPPHRWEKEEVVSDVLALLDELGIGRALLVTHDWGGYIGHLLVLREPERFSAHLALDIPHPWWDPQKDLGQLWRFYYQPLVAFLGVPVQTRTDLLFTLIRRAMSRRVPDADLRWFTDRFRDPVVARAGADTYRTFLVKEVPAARRAPERRRATVPTRTILSERDPVIRPSMAAAETARADDYTLELVPGAGHFIADEQPALIRERLVQLAAEFPPR